MKKVLLSIAIFIVSVIVWFLIWTQFYYTAQLDTLAITIKNNKLLISENRDTISIVPSSWIVQYTFIFYPGAKVDAHAYISKLWKIAIDHTMKIIISKPPLHLQLFAINAAENIVGDNIIIWGHSLGGSMACEYVKSHPHSVSGMILMWAYCNGDITSQTWLKTLILAWSNDGVLPVDKLQAYNHNLPTWYMFYTISGSAHAQFGDYGPQKGDGISTVSDEDVATQISEQIGMFLEGMKK